MKAIETVFDGYRFRSRLEARWAVFFKTLGIKYEYEKEGYDLDGVWYLPDFCLPEQEYWIEIKGQKPTGEEEEKALRLAAASGKKTFIFHGDIPLVTGESIFRKSTPLNAWGAYPDIRSYYSDFDWLFCDLCRKWYLFTSTWDGPLGLPCDCEGKMEKLFIQQGWGHINVHQMLHLSGYQGTRPYDAYIAARQARFEHGEQGTPTRRESFSPLPSIPASSHSKLRPVMMADHAEFQASAIATTPSLPTGKRTLSHNGVPVVIPLPEEKWALVKKRCKAISRKIFALLDGAVAAAGMAADDPASVVIDVRYDWHLKKLCSPEISQVVEQEMSEVLGYPVKAAFRYEEDA